MEPWMLVIQPKIEETFQEVGLEIKTFNTFQIDHNNDNDICLHVDIILENCSISADLYEHNFDKEVWVYILNLGIINAYQSFEKIVDCDTLQNILKIALKNKSLKPTFEFITKYKQSYH